MANVRRITAIWSGLAGLPGTSTMYFQDTALTLGDLLDGLDEFWTGVTTFGSSTGGLNQNVTITLDSSIPIVDVTTGTIVDFEAISEPHVYHGNGTGEPLPPQTQYLIQWKTSSVVSGRLLRGRTFIGGLTEDHSTGGVPATTQRGLLEGYAQTLSAESMQLYSPTHHEAHGVSSATVWTQFASLRSRRD